MSRIGPARTSRFVRKGGTKKSWIMSGEASTSPHWRVRGGHGASSISRWPPGCSTFHIHCLAADEDLQRIGGGWYALHIEQRAADEQGEEHVNVARVQVISKRKLFPAISPCRIGAVVAIADHVEEQQEEYETE